MPSPACRFCDTVLDAPFFDLGETPLANSYLRKEDLKVPEPSYPLRVYVCPACFLVQLADFEKSEEIFNDHYAYFSSYSESWLKHAHTYVNEMTSRFHLKPSQFVMEIASNDGYLLQYFLEKKIPVLGIEPSSNVAQAARKKGIPTLIQFFNSQTARQLADEGEKADLLIGNNVFAHVPQLNDFVEGMKHVLKPRGMITLEFPHWVKLVEENQFDTIYHEHFSYFTLNTAERILAKHGLTVFDVDRLPTHGGSLRIYARHHDNSSFPVQGRVHELRQEEIEKGFESPELYSRFSKKVEQVKRQVLQFLERTRLQQQTVMCYGAPAKGNTLLNFCGITAKEIPFTVDVSPHKQGYLLPGSRIPIHAPEAIKKAKPDYVWILPWNLKEEIEKQTSYIREWRGRFVTAIPEMKVW